ncbi:MAG: hemerythrin domain-containing protein [Gammaproteobacteria bacterium]|nr:hemerythrin domain-containing protein [Gammaproteobacteria bacterium]
MMSIQSVMSHDHKRCDDLFSNAEQLVSKKLWDEAQLSLKDFCHSLLSHFEHEENTLFPAFENATGMQGGPTMMMRHEHGQMRELLNEMEIAAEQHNQARYLGLSETLLILMQQHNMKEEQILYPMIDKECGEQADELTASIRNTINSDVA